MKGMKKSLVVFSMVLLVGLASMVSIGGKKAYAVDFPVDINMLDVQYAQVSLDMEGYINTSTLNVRSGPGTNYRIIGSVSNGELVRVYGASPGPGTKTEWLLIKYNTPSGTKAGWVSHDYVFVAS
ncbi:SH3 domain-containing protein [Clostridium folliculivorans]|uniref:SH3b domain-containing protein n=1 Tax=Clostridium folliculivorans TaxID=2886038 RepID=A0A9W5Y5Q9_9CLOT|nr:SH3 domain-containing protein [Clostridium folliculivorans]GKU27161.1 hypothetical protein CFOLD11_39880 [Clostridium folliculivorans]GKU31778.1 hypothetical protein CFB3_38850 [Clostridium folliculivorans]